MTMTKLLVATGALMLLNTLAIGGLLFLAFAALEEVRAAEDQVAPILDFLDHPASPESRAVLHDLTDAASAFVLGPITGHIGYLADSLFRTDFGALGRAVEYFASNVTQAVASSPHCASSSDDSGSGFCLDPYLRTVVGAMQSVASKVRLLGAINPSYPLGTAALDGGVFGVNGVFRFVKAQMNSTAWHSAGTVCEAFKVSVRNVSWTGSFWDAVDNQTVSFNWDSTVANVFSDGGFIDQLCDAMQHMGTS